MSRAREVRLRRRPEGHVREDDFEIAEVALAPLQPGEVRVRNTWMSLDPYMRLGLTSQTGYLASTQPGDTMGGAAVGIVDASREPSLAVGASVLSQLGWRSHFNAPASALSLVDPDVPPSWHLGFLGLTGITAWIGIERVLKPLAGETIFVSGAAGAVGSVACQLARLRGARVLGSTKSPAKATWLLGKVGVDAVADYEREPLAEFLAREAPDGVDCYFDNVGGEMLETMLGTMNPHGRIGACGAMSQYESGDYRVGPANFFAIIEKSLCVHGFNAFLASAEETRDAVSLLSSHAAAGRIDPCETIVNGLDSVPAAFAGLFDRGYLGKLVVEL